MSTFSTDPFVCRRVVIGAAGHAAVKAALHAALPALEIRSGELASIAADDLAWADTFVGFKRPALPTMGNVHWVHCTGAGVDAWLYPRELPREILLTRTSESFGPMIAEWALARALAFTQELLPLAEAQHERRWAAREIRFVRGTRALIVGTGDVGSHIARLFRDLECEVSGVSRSGRGDASVFSRVHNISELAALVGETDWLILALPLTRETHGLITREVLTACRGAVLINAGRGAVVDEPAIPDALNAGALRGAALDVFEVEPLPPSSPLWDDRRVMISPHLSGPTTTAGAASGFIECHDALARGAMPRWVVDRGKQY